MAVGSTVGCGGGVGELISGVGPGWDRRQTGVAAAGCGDGDSYGEMAFYLSPRIPLIQIKVVLGVETPSRGIRPPLKALERHRDGLGIVRIGTAWHPDWKETMSPKSNGHRSFLVPRLNLTCITAFPSVLP